MEVRGHVAHSSGADSCGAVGASVSLSVKYHRAQWNKHLSEEHLQLNKNQGRCPNPQEVQTQHAWKKQLLSLEGSYPNFQLSVDSLGTMN
jgi:hypothetical protein